MKGISRRTTKLGFNVLRLHYTADPDKDPSTLAGKRWLEEAKMGMSDARWRQEHEIDYGALGGTLVFPGFEESIHVTPPCMEDLSDEKGQQRTDRYTIWQGADPHPRTPDAFLWLAVNKDGEFAVVWSWWPNEKLIVRRCAEKLKLIDGAPLGLMPRYRVMDVAGKSFNVDEEHDFFDAYRTAKDDLGKDIGVHFQPAKKNRDLSGYDLINDALTPRKFVVGDKEELRPLLTIWKDCGDNDKLVWQFKNLRFREWKGTVTDKDAPEEPEQKERHLIDCLSYILLDGPRFIERRRNRGTWKPINPALGY
jgi:hypothetical protein